MDVGIKGQNVDYWQLMMFVDFIVVEVVCRGDFYIVCVFFYIGVFIVYDWDVMIDDWQNDFFINQIFIMRIFWVNCNICIVEYGFWMGGGNYDVIFIICCFYVIGQWVVEVLYVIFGFFIFYFQIGDCSVQFWILVNQVFIVVD